MSIHQEIVNLFIGRPVYFYHSYKLFFATHIHLVIKILKENTCKFSKKFNLYSIKDSRESFYEISKNIPMILFDYVIF